MDLNKFAENLIAKSRNITPDLSSQKRLQVLALAAIIDDGRLREASISLEYLYKLDNFTESEKDVKVMVSSLHGLLLKNFAKT